MSGGGHVRVGISGWTYAPWRGRFYPKGLAPRDELGYAAERLDTIEINGTFYSLQRPETFARWHDETPADFVFAVKGSRYVTHLKQLNDVAIPLANFFASGLLRLEAKLGPVLWQLPPRLRFDRERIARFFALLPPDTTAAAALARRHDHRLRTRAWSHTDHPRPLRHAIEIRHPSFLDPDFIALLREHGHALVFADSVDWPYAEDLTADFVYLRLHGAQELYASGYDEAALARWAARLERWRAGDAPQDARLAAPDSAPPRRNSRDAYVYFDNDAKVRAPFDAMALRARLASPA